MKIEESFIYKLHKFFKDNGFNCSDVNFHNNTFYMPYASTWVKVIDGSISDFDAIFGRNDYINFLIIDSNKNGLFIENLDKDEFYNHEKYRFCDVYINSCYKCNEKTFVNIDGNFACRYCGYHDGDHGLTDSLADFLKGLL